MNAIIPILGSSEEEERKRFRELGFTLYLPLCQNPLWRSVELPKGWTILDLDVRMRRKESSKEGRSKVILDENGSRRFRILANQYEIPVIKEC